MDAVISGRVGKALLLEGDSLSSFDVDDPGTFVPMQPADFHMLFGDAPDLQFLEDTSVGEVAKALEFEHVCACALDLTLISLDPELSTGVRIKAVEALEELLNDSRVTENLENILYAKPLPPSADIAGTLECCEATRSKSVSEIVQFLESHQQAIREVHLAWEATLTDVFDDKEKARIQRVALSNGFFRHLVLTRGSQRRRLAALEAEAKLLRAELAEMDSIISQTEAAIHHVLSTNTDLTPATPSDAETPLAVLEHNLREAFTKRSRLIAPLADLEARVERLRGEASVEVKNTRFYNSTIPQAADQILRESGGPLHVNEIYNRLLEGGFQFTGHNPPISIAVALNRNRRFRKVAPGIFDLTNRNTAEEKAS